MRVLATSIILMFMFPITGEELEQAKRLYHETILNYAYFSDTGQREKFGELFTKNGALITSGSPRFPNQTITAADRAPRTTRHVTTNHIVEEQNGKLVGTSYFTLYYNPIISDTPLPMTGQPVAMGVYYDKYVIDNGICKFEERVAKATFAGE